MRELKQPCVILCRPGVPASELVADLDREQELGDHSIIAWGNEAALLQLVPDQGEVVFLAEIVRENGHTRVLYLDEDREVYDYTAGGFHKLGTLKKHRPDLGHPRTSLLSTENGTYFIDLI